MNVETSIARVTAELGDVGALTKMVADRFEGVFHIFRAELATAAEQAPTLKDAARDIIAILDAAASSFSTSFPHQPAIDCAAGCAFCCHLTVAAPPGVAELICAHVAATFTAQEQTRLRDRLRASREAIDGADNPVALRRACPLLGPDHRCTVYAVRPISCRAFTSPSVTGCQALVFGPEGAGAVAQNPSLYRLHKEATAALERTARARGLPGGQRFLPHALLEALQALS